MSKPTGSPKKFHNGKEVYCSKSKTFTDEEIKQLILEKIKKEYKNTNYLNDALIIINFECTNGVIGYKYELYNEVKK